MKDFVKIYQLKGMEPKNKGQTNFYECCDLTKKVYLVNIQWNISTEVFQEPKLLVPMWVNFFPQSETISGLTLKMALHDASIIMSGAWHWYLSQEKGFSIWDFD